jgi:hypothetical protein
LSFFAGQALIQSGNQTVRMRTKGNLSKKLALLLIMSLSMATMEPGPERNSGQGHLPLNLTPLPVAFPAPVGAIADFDGDLLPDRAELISDGSQKHIHLALSSLQVTDLRFYTDSQQRGNIYARDVDHDNDNDLVWVSDQQPVQIALWINNGAGGFTRAADTSAYEIEIERLIADESRSGFLASSAGEQTLAIVTNSSPLPARNDSSHFAVSYSTTLAEFDRNCAAELSPCIARYPKRGPPAQLS